MTHIFSFANAMTVLILAVNEPGRYFPYRNLILVTSLPGGRPRMLDWHHHREIRIPVFMSVCQVSLSSECQHRYPAIQTRPPKASAHKHGKMSRDIAFKR